MTARARRRRRRVLPARVRPRAGDLGAPPGARRARRRRRRPRRRPAPPRPAARPRCARATSARIRDRLAQPRRTLLNGLPVEYVPFVAPPRDRTYGSWGAWAAPPLRIALHRLRSRFPFDLVHAHYAVPAGDAVRRVAPAGAARRLSVHGGDVLWTVHRGAPRARTSSATLGHARLVLANSAGTAELTRRHGAGAVRVVHLGDRRPRRGAGRARGRRRRRSSPSATSSRASATPTSIRALAVLRDRHPALRYVIVGDGPERERARRARRARSASATASSFRGAAPARRGGARARATPTCSCCPAPTRRSASPTSRRWRAASRRSARCGEPGPEEIAAARAAACGSCRRGRRGARRRRSTRCSPTTRERRELGRQARATVERAFTWERCGERDPRRLRARRSGDERRAPGPVRHRQRAAVARRPVRRAARRRRTSSSRCSAAARSTRWRPRASCRSRTSARASAACTPWPPQGASAPSCAARAGAPPFPAAYLGARRARACRSSCGRRSGSTRAASPAPPAIVPLRTIYRSSDAVVTYGPHVSAYVRAKGARDVFEAPQAVDNEFWGAEAAPERLAPFQILFVGRASREKGTQALLAAWRASGLAAPHAALVLVGGGPFRSRAVATSAVLPDDGIVEVGTVDAARSCATSTPGRTFAPYRRFRRRTIRETWSLVANEAMNQGVPIIASDAVGAAAGGLVRDGAQRPRRARRRPDGARGRDDAPPRGPRAARAARRRRPRGRHALHGPGVGGRHVRRAHATSGKAG